MRVDELPLPAALQDVYAHNGITALFPPQESCVAHGLFEGKNLLVAVPTASGKTLVAEMAMHRHVADGGKCLYIVPLKALASEKLQEFSGKGVRIGISTGDFDRKDEMLGHNDIIIATSEKLDSLLRNKTPWLEDLTLLVVDEVHLLDSPDRGPTLEMVITKLRYRNPEMQLLALSATIGNPDILAGWLGAEAVTSQWRPVELREGVYYRGEIRFPSGVRTVEQVSKYDDLNLCLDTIAEGGQCLVFVSSRRNAEALARRVAAALKKPGGEPKTFAERIQKDAETEMGRELAACVAQGAAFHHAGLSRKERSLVEEGFRKGAIACIAATPTLAAGLNLPARRVIIRDHMRYQAGEGMACIPVREYHQMAGRAGRPRLDPYGEAVLIGKSEEDVAALFDNYIAARPEDVQSRCAGQWALCAHILSLVATRFATRRGDLADFMRRTLYHYQGGDAEVIEDIIDRNLEYLREAEMVSELGGTLAASEYGSVVSRLYIDPRGAELVAGYLREQEFSTLSALLVVCSTPDMPRLYVRKSDLFSLQKHLSRMGADGWNALPYDEGEGLEGVYRSLKTALLLQDWIDEVPEAMICERYGVGQGDVHAMVESVTWLIHATSMLARLFAQERSHDVRELELRIKQGVKRELLPLVSLRGIGRVRARRLFNNGIKDRDAIVLAGRERISPILGHGITDQVFAQLARAPEEACEEGAQKELGDFSGGI
ncbi:MAG: ATP-dependent DNA helicase [Methanomicrobiales archaeon]|nr:ATP-dependent DNA helicase [Methanomicrobiales archaeon]